MACQRREPSGCCQHSLVFAEIDNNAKWLIEQGTPQAVANTALSCAKLGFDAPNLFAEIDCHAEWLAFLPAVANTAWSCATLGFNAPNLFAEIDNNARLLVKEGKPQEIANTAWSCATLGFNAANLFAEIDNNAEWLVKEGPLKLLPTQRGRVQRLGLMYRTCLPK